MEETHEPEIPLPGWPKSHVKVENVFFQEVPECCKITIHGCDHYLHNTTAFALYMQLQEHLKNLSDLDKHIMIINGTHFGPELL